MDLKKKLYQTLKNKYESEILSSELTLKTYFK